MSAGLQASQLTAVLAEAVGLNPSDVMCVDLHLRPGELATLTFKVVVADDSGRPLVEDGEIVMAIRKFREVEGAE